MHEGDGMTIDFAMVEPLWNLIHKKGLVPLVPLYTDIFTHDILIVIISQHASALMQMILGDRVPILDQCTPQTIIIFNFTSCNINGS